MLHVCMASLNILNRFSDISCMTENSENIIELALDGNPLANNPDYQKTLIYKMEELNKLDGKTLTVCSGLHYYIDTLMIEEI